MRESVRVSKRAICIQKTKRFNPPSIPQGRSDSKNRLTSSFCVPLNSHSLYRSLQAPSWVRHLRVPRLSGNHLLTAIPLLSTPPSSFPSIFPTLGISFLLLRPPPTPFSLLRSSLSDYPFPPIPHLYSSIKFPPSIPSPPAFLDSFLSLCPLLCQSLTPSPFAG